MADSLSLLIKSAFDATGITAATNSINKIDSQISRVTRGLQKFSGLLAGGTAGAAAVAFIVRTNDAYKESEKAVNLFTKAYQNLTTATQADVREQLDYADKLQKVTKYTDEQILAVQTQLVTYGLMGEELKRATLATLNLATKTGSTESAAKLMGKAFQGQTDTLSKYGIKIDSNAKGAAKYAAVIAEVENRLGGMAETEGRSLKAGERLGKSMDELYEKIGRLVDGPLSDFVNLLIQIVDVLPKVADAVVNGDKKISASDGVFSKAAKAAWNNLNIFKALGNAAEGATKAIMGVKPPPEFVGPPAPVKPKLSSGEKDEDWEKYMSVEEQARRMDAIIKDQRGQVKTLRDYDAFTLTERGQLYTRFFGRTAMESRRNMIAQARNAEEMKDRQQEVLRDLESDYEKAGHTFSGGFQQAYLEMGQGMSNWRDNWNQVISGSIAPAQQAFKDFFNQGNSGFLNWGKLAEKTFKGILNAFYDMLTQMAAKAAVYGVFSMFGGGGLLGGSLGKFLSRDTGGPIPGSEGAPVPIMAHGGEFVLSANVVKAIKAGAPTANLSAGLAAAGAGGGNVVTNNITLNGSASDMDISRICEQITEATKAGLRQAGEMANVLTKTGTKRAGMTGL